MKTKYLNLRILIVSLVLVTFFTSCEGDLDVTPQDDQNTLADEFFQNESAYLEVLASVYGNLALTGTDGAGSSNIQGLDAGTSQYGRTLLYMQTLAADQMIWSYENDPGTREIQRNIWTTQNPIFLGFWGRAHTSVAFANNLLRETTDAKLDERNVSAATRAEIVNFRAEARLLRALSYYHLMDLFGKANFITEDDALNTIPQVYDRAQLFAFIESELQAINSDLVAPRQNQYGRADQAVAWMILSKMYLNAEVYIGQAKYTEALTELNKILGGGFMLADEYAHNFMADNDVNSAINEIIFPIGSDGLVTQNFGPGTVMINGSVGSIEVNGAEVGVEPGGWGGALRVRKQFADLFDGGLYSTDTRNTIISEGRTVNIIDISDRDSGYIIQKYSNATSTGGFGIDQVFVDTDFPLFRLADVYLMYAEAVLRGGNGGDMNTAKGFIDALRTRANNPNLVPVGDITLEFILDERSRELHWEAHRRQDLIRYGLFTGGNYNWAWKGNGSNGIAIPLNYDLYPIPAASLSSNPNLTQNPGY
tara:strand:+ start:90109 stop:91716 length:1608 start_codon:yes stop_codon:yes gene_type:complete